MNKQLFIFLRIVFLVLIGTVVFLVLGKIFGINTGFLIGGGIMMLFVLIFYLVNKSKVPTKSTPKDTAKQMWLDLLGLKQATTQKRVTTAQVVGKILIILAITGILFILFQNRLSPQAMAVAIPLFIIFLLILFLGAPAKFFKGLIVITGLPGGFWLLSFMSAPPIMISLFLIAYLVNSTAL